MRRYWEFFLRLLNSQQGRYVVTGVFNVVVNYVVGAAIYQWLLPLLNFFVVGVIVTIVSITISFTTHKLFVFETEDKWWVEYLRSYIVYGSSAVLNVGLMWFFLSHLHMNVWLAQAIVTGIAVIISYIGHMGFTFRNSRVPGAKSVAR